VLKAIRQPDSLDPYRLLDICTSVLVKSGTDLRNRISMARTCDIRGRVELLVRPIDAAWSTDSFWNLPDGAGRDQTKKSQEARAPQRKVCGTRLATSAGIGCSSTADGSLTPMSALKACPAGWSLSA
jgi:hypothetical protein